MKVGCVREVKPDEGRVSLTPTGADTLVRDGHQVLIERGAGSGSGFTDDEYATVGADIVERDRVWAEAELLVKVKEPVAAEYGYLRSGQVLFAFLHLAADRGLTEALIASGATAIAFETVERPDGSLPLLAPMSAVAGRLAAQAGAQFLTAPYGGRGVLLGPVGGVRPAQVVIVGGGIVGTNAAEVAAGMGARVLIFDLSIERLDALRARFGGAVELAMSSQLDLDRAIAHADLVIGAVLVAGARAPKVISRDALRSMPDGGVMSDVSIDQGGCAETSHPTTHSDPVFVEEGIVHHCVSNLPGAVPRTATHALQNATLPYLRKLAANGEAALDQDESLRRGLNVRGGKIVHGAVAAAFEVG